jgi:phosphotriesterase-related protein
MPDSISTVLGSVPASALKRVLPHEHIASVYGGWGRLEKDPNPCWEDAILDHYGPLLTKLSRDYGCNAIVESTPGWECRGPRDIEVMAELSRRSGVHIVLATGYFFTHWFSNRRPEGYAALSEAALAETMIRDITDGIHGTPVRAGIIKVSVGRFDADDIKLLRAVAIAQRETGVSISTCGGNRERYVDVLRGAGVSPERIVLGHGDASGTIVELLDLMSLGCKTVFTIWGIRNPTLIGWPHRVPPPRHYSAELAAAIIAEGYADHLLFSVDYSAMNGFDGNQLREDLYEIEGRNYLYLFEQVLDELRAFGVSDEAIEHILTDNPKRMLLSG